MDSKFIRHFMNNESLRWVAPKTIGVWIYKDFQSLLFLTQYDMLFSYFMAVIGLTP